MIDIEAPDIQLPTEKDVSLLCKEITTDIKKYVALNEKKEVIPDLLLNRLKEELERLSTMTEITGFYDTIFSSDLYPYFRTLISFPKTEISSSFMSVLTDLAEDPNHIERIIKEEFIQISIKACEKIDEVNVQSDAQFMYLTFELLSITLDGCDDSKQVSETVLKETNILKLIEKEFTRDDFDENVLAASELLAIMLQTSPSLVKTLNIGLVNLIVRFCANMRATKHADEDEAASNGFNIIILLAMDKEGIDKLIQINAIEVLLACTEIVTNSKTEKSSARLALNAIEACCSSSSICCEQLVDHNGLKKIFSFLREGLVQNQSLCSNVISIIESMLTQLPIESTSMQRVMLKFIDDNSSKVQILIKIGEKLFENVKFDDDGNIAENDDSFDTFCLVCSCLVVLVGIGTKEVKISVLQGVIESEVIDSELIIDSASIRAEMAQSIKERLDNSIKTFNQLTHN